MAQPPDITETFVREVDENLRRDRVRDFFRDNAAYIIAAVVLFLAMSGGIIWYQHHKRKLAEQHVEQFAAIYKDIGLGNTSKAPQQLDELAKSSSDAVSTTALFTRAALALQQGDTKLATATYRKLAEDGSLPDAYRNAALIRQTALEFDQLEPQQVIARLEPLAKPGNPWFGSAGEMTALAMIKQGKSKQAGQLFATIAKDKGVPETLRNRAVQIAGSLGADASAALGPQGQ